MVFDYFASLSGTDDLFHIHRTGYDKMCQSCGMHIRGSKHCDLAHLDVQMLKLRTPKPPTQWCRPYRPPVPNLLPALPRPACPVPTLPRYLRYIRRLVPTPPATADIRHRQRI